MSEQSTFESVIALQKLTNSHESKEARAIAKTAIRWAFCIMGFDTAYGDMIADITIKSMQDIGTRS